MIINNNLKFTIEDIELSQNEAIGGMLVGHDEKDDEKFQKAFHEYEKYDRLLQLGYEMLIDGKLDDWDWKWAVKLGYLCEMDFEWFELDLKKAEINKEEYYEQWK